MSLIVAVTARHRSPRNRHASVSGDAWFGPIDDTGGMTAMDVCYRGQLAVPGFVNFAWNVAFTVTIFFQRRMEAGQQSLVGNGFTSLASWEMRLPQGANTDAFDTIATLVTFEVRWPKHMTPSHPRTRTRYVSCCREATHH